MSILLCILPESHVAKHILVACLNTLRPLPTNSIYCLLNVQNLEVIQAIYAYVNCAECSRSSNAGRAMNTNGWPQWMSAPEPPRAVQLQKILLLIFAYNVNEVENVRGCLRHSMVRPR